MYHMYSWYMMFGRSTLGWNRLDMVCMQSNRVDHRMNPMRMMYIQLDAHHHWLYQSHTRYMMFDQVDSGVYLQDIVNMQSDL